MIQRYSYLDHEETDGREDISTPLQNRTSHSHPRNTVVLQCCTKNGDGHRITQDEILPVAPGKSSCKIDCLS